MEPSVRDRILDSAEARARAGGYHGFSFRDIAEDVGIKSASVHYHFPTKAALGVALTERYAQRARDWLGDPKALTPKEAIARLTELFRNALIKDDKMCLCGLFGAERDLLPSEVAAETAKFFEMTIDYLTTAFGPNWPGIPPASILARLEGALILARALNSHTIFENSLAGVE